MSLEEWNHANMIKLLQNLCGKVDILWNKWIHCYCIKQNNVMIDPIRRSCSWILKPFWSKGKKLLIHMPRTVCWTIQLSKIVKCTWILNNMHRRSIGGTLCREMFQDLELSSLFGFLVMIELLRSKGCTYLVSLTMIIVVFAGVKKYCNICCFPVQICGTYGIMFWSGCNLVIVQVGSKMSWSGLVIIVTERAGKEKSWR